MRRAAGAGVLVAALLAVAAIPSRTPVQDTVQTGARATGVEPTPTSAAPMLGTESVAGARGRQLRAPPWRWDLPEGIAPPPVPPDNPMTPEKVALGRHLFYDRRLSGNESYSCATCHTRTLGFADSHARAVGSTGQTHPRGAPGLANVAWMGTLTWADPALRSLEEQALVPMFGSDPVELGLAGLEDELLARLAATPRYDSLFAAAFPGQPEPVTLRNVTHALAAFERSLVSFDAPWDRARAGDRTAMSPAAHRGETLFLGDRLGCAGCHAPPFFTVATVGGPRPPDSTFFNVGLYDVGGTGRYPEGNEGLHGHTGRPGDMGRFRTPSLRNVAVTAPYMHDGSVGNLEDVLDLYARGGRAVSDGRNAGDGRANPHRSQRLGAFRLTARERADVVAFLTALTDRTFLVDPRHGDPWLERDLPPG